MVSLIKIIFCFSVLCFSAFVQLPVLQYDFGVDVFTHYDYSLLYISCFVLSLLFKNNYSFAAVVLYLLAGIFGLPVFAFGGGLSYIFEPSFGYLLGLIPLSILGFYFRYHLADYGVKTFRGRSLGPLLAIVAAHVLGLVFLLITGRLNIDNVLNMSLFQFIYDVLFAYIFLIALPVRLEKVDAEPGIISKHDTNNRESNSQQDRTADLQA